METAMLDEFSRKKKASADSQPSSQNVKSPSHSSDSASVPPRFEAPKLGVSRIAQLEKAKREGADYQKQREGVREREKEREKEEKRQKASPSETSGKQQETKSREQSQASDSIPPEMQFSQTFIDSFFEEREPIPPLTEEEEREIYRLVNEYYQEHPPEGADYLVTGAAFICKYCQETNGSCEPLQMFGKDRGVYADAGCFPLLSSGDRLEKGCFGKCKYAQENISQSSNLRPQISTCTSTINWQNISNVEFNDGSRALTMDSYTFCEKNPTAIIAPISSGLTFMRKYLLEEKDSPIIIVPGVMGSRLYKDPSVFTKDTQVWDPGTFFSAMSLDEYTPLTQPELLYTRPCENQNYLSPKYAEGSVKRYGREYGAQNSAKTLIDGLCQDNRIGGRGIYFFSYDWRKSNFESATALRNFIEALCLRRNYRTVDLLGHSMGGLVISALYSGKIAVPLGDGDFTVCTDTSIRSKIGKIITLGTPYEGAPKLIDSVVRWNVLGSGDVLKKLDFINMSLDTGLAILGGLKKELKASFPGVAELIPSQQYIEYLDSQSYEEYLEMCNRIWGEKILSRVVQFQKSIRMNGRNALLDYENAFFFVGTRHSTLCQLDFEDEAFLYRKKYESSLKYAAWKWGDGTVPLLSSTMCGELENNAHFRKYNGSHVELVSRANSIYHDPELDKWKGIKIKHQSDSIDTSKMLLDDVVNVLTRGRLL